jgi:hypothetical protein
VSRSSCFSSDPSDPSDTSDPATDPRTCTTEYIPVQVRKGLMRFPSPGSARAPERQSPGKLRTRRPSCPHGRGGSRASRAYQNGIADLIAEIECLELGRVRVRARILSLCSRHTECKLELGLGLGLGLSTVLSHPIDLQYIDFPTQHLQYLHLNSRVWPSTTLKPLNFHLHLRRHGVPEHPTNATHFTTSTPPPPPRRRPPHSISRWEAISPPKV